MAEREVQSNLDKAQQTFQDFFKKHKHAADISIQKLSEDEIWESMKAGTPEITLVYGSTTQQLLLGEDLSKRRFDYDRHFKIEAKSNNQTMDIILRILSDEYDVNTPVWVQAPIFGLKENKKPSEIDNISLVQIIGVQIYKAYTTIYGDHISAFSGFAPQRDEAVIFE